MFSRAQQYAEFNMRCRGAVPVTLFLLGPQGPAVFIPSTFGSDSSKDAFAFDARLVCIAHGATHVVMIAESWEVLAGPGVPLDPSQRPSESPHRREVIALMGESAGIQQMKILPIRRSPDGGFTGFGEVSILPCDNIEGRFARLLPERPPTPREQARARLLLMSRGIGMDVPSRQQVRERCGHQHGFSC